MPQSPLDVEAIRRRFPGLLRRSGDRQAVFFDGPAGSQVPRSVAEAMSNYLLFSNGNAHNAFSTSVETDAMTEQARQAMTDMLGNSDTDEIVFGPNMTTLTFHLSHALARTWRPGEEIVITDSDNDANVMPWVTAARDAGCTVQRIAVRKDASIDLDDAASKIGSKTRLVAISAASNLSGTLHDVAALCELARKQGAMTFVDAVHYAPHQRMDVSSWGCDFAVCSVFKFFGPHAAVLFGRRALLSELEAYKTRPALDQGGEKWQTGTANFEAIAGTLAAIDYLAALGREHMADEPKTRRKALDSAFETIVEYERGLGELLLRGLSEIKGVSVVGIADPERMRERGPTFAFTHPRMEPAQLAAKLAERHIHSFSGNSYAIALSQALGLEPQGALRLGVMHYNTAEEVDYVLAQLRELLG